MSAIRMAACEAIAARIGEAIPDLLTNSKASQDDEEEIATYPALRVLPRRLELIPMQEDEIETDDDLVPDFPSVMLAKVGEFEGSIEIRIYCLSRVERNRLEDEVTALFLETEGAPGTLPVVTAPIVLKGRQTLYGAPVGCSLDTEEWDEERVFDKQRFSFINTLVNFPVLIARTGAARITDLRLAISQDLDSTVPDEVVRVNEDGTLSPSS